MTYEDDYKKWLEEMLIESNPDWVCDGMYDLEFTHEWCGEHCGEDSNYVTPKCLHLYYHYIAREDRKTENNSEKPNNCEHITEDGVTCAKYPACDDCLDNPLNKVKGSERLLKGKDEPTISKMEQVDKPKTQNSNKNSNVISVYDGVSEAVRCAMCSNPNKSNRGCDGACLYDEKLYERIMKAIAESVAEDEPQTERSE